MDEMEPRPESIIDQATPDAPTVAVTADAVAGASRRGRWILAGLVSVLVIAGAIAAAVILGAKPLPEAYRYLPANSLIVGEMRPDLPGDQRQHLGNFLAHFPGFADQSILTAKIDETLDRLVSGASSGSVDYATRVKPLLAGPLVFGAGAEGLKGRAGLMVATTDGAVTCQIVFGSAAALETYRGVALESATGDLACARDGRFMLIGDPASLRGGIDAHLDHRGVDSASRFTAARQRITGDQVALVYVDRDALTTLASEFMQGLVPGGGVDSALTENVAEWLVIGIRVVDDAIQVEMQAAPIKDVALGSSVPTDPPPSASRFAALLPTGTLGFVEVHGVGANLQRGLAILKANSAQADAVTQIEQALAAVGGIENVAAWIEDAGIAVVPTADAVGGIVLLGGTDRATVDSRVTQIRNLLVLASIGSDITVRDTEHAGVKISTVDLGDLSSLLPALGVDAGPIIGARLALSLAARDDVLMLAIGDGVIEDVLDTATGSSLKSSAAYGRVAQLVGSPNDVELFVALDGLLGYLEANLPAALDDPSWTELKPYLDHLASFGEANLTTTSGGQSRVVITVK